MRTLWIISVFLVTSMSAQQTQYLISDWEVGRSGVNNFTPATVPGYLHLDLLELGLIEHPFIGNNALSQDWVSRKDWVYRTTFEVNGELMAEDQIELIFEGIDTYAVIALNGTVVGKTDNMFLEWRFDVSDQLVDGENQLEVTLISPLYEGERRLEELGYELPGDEYARSKPSSMFTRKAAYQYGWDWCPRTVSMGIWKPVRLEGWSHARITDVTVTTKSIGNEAAVMQAEVGVDAAPDTYSVRLYSEDGVVFFDKEIQIDSAGSTLIDFEISDPQLWWPNGSGDANLYRAHMVLKKMDLVYSDVPVHFGVRTIELIQEADRIGTSFRFLVNRSSVFIRGANYVPQDMFPVEDEQRTRDLLVWCKESNINMVRVWGGGIYEHDRFYDLCDSLGIMVWQDFMFANAMYPFLDDFLENVKSEATYQTDRLTGHPCIALWCGNNEVDVAWDNWGWKDGREPYALQRMEEIDELIFGYYLPEAVGDHAPYIRSSPMSNWGTDENFNHHNMHYWGVWHGDDDLDGFTTHISRFMTEYGFPSYSSLELLDDWVPSSAAADSLLYDRLLSYKGNGQLARFIEQYFKEPEDDQEFIYYSQLTQQLAMGMAIKAHRSSRPHCMGTMFWQLNDAWPGASWSVLEYDLDEKAAGHSLAMWYAPVSGFILNDASGTSMHWVNDTRKSEELITTIECFSLDGERISFGNSIKTVQANSAISETIDMSSDPRIDPSNSYLRMTVTYPGAEVSQDIGFLVPVNELELVNPEFSYSIEDGELVVSVSSLAYGVEVVADGVRFEENYLIITPDEPVRIPFTSELSDNDILTSLSIRSFY